MSIMSKDNPKKLLMRDYATSSFHVPMSAPSSSECLDSLQTIEQFADCLQQFCGAGTHAARKISALLIATSYQEIAGQFLMLQQHIDGAMSTFVTQIKSQLDVYMKHLSCDYPNDDGGKSQKPEDLQIMTMGLVLMLQLQQQFFITATEKISCFSQSHVLNKTNGMTFDPSLPNIHNTDYLDSSENHRVIGSSKSDPETQHTTNPGFRMLEKPKSSYDVKSMYNSLGISSKGAGLSHDSKSVCINEKTDEPKSDVKDKPAESVNSINNPRVSQSSVSDAEIDVVIDMLSRATKYSDIAENDKARNDMNKPSASLIEEPRSISRAPGSQFVNAGNLMIYREDQIGLTFFGDRASQHRQSDGFIMETQLSGDMKTNTWPFRPRQKVAVHPWHNLDYPQVSSYNTQGVYDSIGYQDAVFGASPCVKIPVLPYMNQANPWGAPSSDANTNKAWPVFNQAGDSKGQMKQWSAVADSSSCSDESSSNGEAAWMMGMNPIDSVNMKRRHSSGGEESAALYGIPSNINKSVDSLMEPNSTNTWPPKHPWNRHQDAGMVLEQDDLGKITHRPLLPQWSDPLAGRPLSVWDTGAMLQHGYMSIPSVTKYNSNKVPSHEEEKHF